MEKSCFSCVHSVGCKVKRDLLELICEKCSGFFWDAKDEKAKIKLPLIFEEIGRSCNYFKIAIIPFPWPPDTELVKKTEEPSDK